MKRIQALIAALVITALVGMGMLAVGLNAVLNPNAVAASNAPGSPAALNTSLNPASSSPSQAQIDQLQSLVAQYQAQLNQDATQIQQYQALLNELQRRGVIRVNGDGSIQLRQRSFQGPGD